MMKAAVVTFLLLPIFAYAEIEDGPTEVPKIPVPTACTLKTKQVLVTKGCCSGYITVGYCVGLCLSSIELTPAVSKVQCTCCTETQMSIRVVDLKCSEGLVAKYSYPTISACACMNSGCNIPQPPVVDATGT